MNECNHFKRCGPPLTSASTKWPPSQNNCPQQLSVLQQGWREKRYSECYTVERRWQFSSKQGRSKQLWCLQHVWNMKRFTNKLKCKNQDILSSSQFHGSQELHRKIQGLTNNLKYDFRLECCINWRTGIKVLLLQVLTHTLFICLCTLT
jgi:hypothetical protein